MIPVLPSVPPLTRGRRDALRRCGAALAIVALGPLGACSSVHGPFVWLDQYAVTPASGAYAMGPGDLVSVQVWDADRYATRARIRPDGRISMPILSDIEMTGRTPADVARDIETRLRQGNLVINPHVTVNVEESRPVNVSVLGAVNRAGTYALEQGGGLAEALASAGGLTEFAHRDRLFVIRRGPQPVRIRFRFSDIADRLGAATMFRLRTGDVVIAE